MVKYQMDCGCSFLTKAEGIIIDYETLPESCPKVWALLARGLTKGVFQLESSLGRQWSQELKPESIDHIAALTALLRPGPLLSVDDKGISLTKHYCLRKNGLEESIPKCPALASIVGETFNVMVYQEQSIAIAVKLAGFSPSEADTLRKSIGKKDAGLMASLETKFVEGCLKVGLVDKEMAISIFNDIKESQRYQFNKCVFKNQRFKKLFKGKYGFNPTVEEMYRIKHDIEYAKKTNHLELHKKYKKNGHYGNYLSMSKDGIVRPNILREINYSGKRDYYRVLTEFGKIIEVTDNHKFPTSDGIKELKHINIDLDYIYVCGQYRTGKKIYPSYREKIVSVLYIGEDDVYDVTMDAPNHNIVVESGIVTCNSHSVGYGISTYRTAYMKAHFPLQFYTASLRHACEKQHPLEEIAELVQEAKLMDIEVMAPDITHLRSKFYNDGKVIYFGLTDIKGIGDSVMAKLRELNAEHELKSLSWYEFLCLVAPKIGESTLTKLIQAGALRNVK